MFELTENRDTGYCSITNSIGSWVEAAVYNPDATANHSHHTRLEGGIWEHRVHCIPADSP